MSSTTVSLKFTPKRMLEKREAAEHCGRPLKRFELECPVSPVRFPNGDLRFDVKDLDQWLDQLKENAQDSESILRRLVAK